MSRFFRGLFPASPAPYEVLFETVARRLHGNGAHYTAVPLSGGLSGALVAAVYSPTHAPFVAKIASTAAIRNEVVNYRRAFPTAGPPPGQVASAAQLQFPLEESDGVCEKGDDDCDYSVLAYNYAGTESVPLTDYLCNAVSSLGQGLELSLATERFVVLMTSLHEVLKDTFYCKTSMEDSTQPAALCAVKPFSVPNVPWETFLPVACTGSAIERSWQEFAVSLPRKWQERLASDHPIDYRPCLCHNDLRGGNLVVNGSVMESRARLTLIDYGSIVEGNPLGDLARLEADLLLRVTEKLDEPYHVLYRVLRAEVLVPRDWIEDPPLEPAQCYLINCLLQVRRIAGQLAARLNLDEAQAFRLYRQYLFGNAVRLVRIDDPDLRNNQNRLYYLWFTLSLARTLLGQRPFPIPFPRQSRGVIEVGRFNPQMTGHFCASALKEVALTSRAGSVQIDLSGHSLWGTVRPKNLTALHPHKHADIVRYNGNIDSFDLHGAIFPALKKLRDDFPKRDYRFKLRVLLLHPHSKQARWVKEMQESSGFPEENLRSARDDIYLTLYILRRLQSRNDWLKFEPVRILSVQKWLEFSLTRIEDHALVARYPSKQLLDEARCVWLRDETNGLFEGYLGQFGEAIKLTNDVTRTHEISLESLPEEIAELKAEFDSRISRPAEGHPHP